MAFRRSGVRFPSAPPSPAARAAVATKPSISRGTGASHRTGVARAPISAAWPIRSYMRRTTRPLSGASRPALGSAPLHRAGPSRSADRPSGRLHSGSPWGSRRIAGRQGQGASPAWPRTSGSARSRAAFPRIPRPRWGATALIWGFERLSTGFCIHPSFRPPNMAFPVAAVAVACGP